MANSKDVLVVTTSSLDGLTIERYLKPVSAHVVAGTNLFNDFFGSLTDIFGGRSQTYQKQLNSLYDEAIERVKYAAYDIGANCILGLSIDMDEISGKGKSMFMLTAVGTAVILQKEIKEKIAIPSPYEKLERIGIERINVLRFKREIIEKSNSGTLNLTDDIWNFITANQVHEVFSYLLYTYQGVIDNDQFNPENTDKFYRKLVAYVDALDDNKKLDLLYKAMKNENSQIAHKISDIIKELHLFDFERSMDLLRNENFGIRKRGIIIVTFDKLFYERRDLKDLQSIKELILSAFPERGSRSTKKGMLSSKEREVWICECGKTNTLDAYCSGCFRNIYGFKQKEVRPRAAVEHINQKLDLIAEYLK